MKIVVADYETFFSNAYTLSRGKYQHTTEHYIRSPQFAAHLCGFRWHDGSYFYVPKPELPAFFAKHDWSQIAVIAHHGHFDFSIMNRHYGVRPGGLMCTLSMARLLLGNHISVGLDNLAQHFGLRGKTIDYEMFRGKQWEELTPTQQIELGTGCTHDCKITWELFNILAKDFPPEEYQVIDSTVRMFTEPCLVGDIPALKQVWADEEVRKQALLAEVGVTVQELRSDAKFAELLRAEGVEPGTKPGTNGPIYAFAKSDKFLKDLEEHENERVVALVEARVGNKTSIKQSRAVRMAHMAQRGPMCIYLSYAGAHTTRFSGGDKLNFQNPPPDLKRCIMAPPGHKLAIVDASQIECVAEGQLVTTRDRGLVPIERVVVDDFVWDGVEWVRHEGVIYKGERDVITYQGLSATADHVIYTEVHKGGITLEAASATGCPIRATGEALPLCKATLRAAIVPGLQDLRCEGYQVQIQVDRSGCVVDAHQSPSQGLHWGGDRPQGQRQALRSRQLATVDATREREQPLYYFLGAGTGRSLSDAGLHAGVSGMHLRSGSDSAAGSSRNDRRTDTGSRQKTKVYDILNAGPRHRFMVSGVIVSNCRILNYLAGQTDVIERFRNGEDPYVNVASEFYKRPITKAEDPEERQVGKVLELQCGFGSGGPKIRETLRIRAGILLDETEALRARDAYRNTHPRVVDYWKEAELNLKRMHSLLSFEWGPMEIRCEYDTENPLGADRRRIILPNGAPLIYDSLEWYDDQEAGDRYWRIKNRHGYAKLYGAKLVENVVQALARVVVTQAMNRIKAAGIRIATMTHDDIVCCIPDDHNIHNSFEFVKEQMKLSPGWLPGIPLDVEGHLSDRYEK